MAIVRFDLPGPALKAFWRYTNERITGEEHRYDLWPTLEREFGKAISSKRQLHLGPEQFAEVEEFFSGWGSSVADALGVARAALLAAEASEATRLRGTELGPAPHRSFLARQEQRLRKKELKNG